MALPGGRRVLLDAAHNAEGAAALGDFLAGAGQRTGSLDLLFGVLGDKDAGEMLAAIWRPGCATRPHHRAHCPARAPPPSSALLGAARPRATCWWSRSRGAALDRALALGAETVVACGSIFLVGELRRLLRERFGVPAPAVDLA